MAGSGLIDDLELFVRVVDAGGLSAAGRLLNLSPSMLSKRIARLEARLGVRLLVRNSRRLALSDIGQGYYTRAQAILAAVDEAERYVSGRARQTGGVLRISAPTSFGRLHVAPHLKSFLDRHPAVRIDIDLSDGFVDLVGGHIDVAIRIGALRDSSLMAQRLAANQRLLCATPAYLARHGAPQSLDELASHCLLAADNQALWRLEGPEGAISLRVDSAIRTNSSEVVRETVLSGMGIALRSTWDIGDAVRDGRLHVVLPRYQGATDVAIHAVHTSGRQASANVRAFIDHLKSCYGSQPPWHVEALPAAV